MGNIMRGLNCSLLKMCKKCVCSFFIIGCIWGVFLSFSAVCIAATNAPHTGLEGNQRHSYGPDAESRQQKKIMAGQGMVDAYGNPVLGEEEEQAPRSRLRSGAFGGSRRQLDERPLPDGPETDAGWNF